MENLVEKESEFGRGLTLCLGLFLAHSERYLCGRCYYSSTSDLNVEVWFNGASDHLFELDTSKIKDKKLKERLESFREKVIHWGHGFDSNDPATGEKKEWAIKEAEDLLMEIDRLELGLNPAMGYR